jgi:hypothetical protein
MPEPIHLNGAEATRRIVVAAGPPVRVRGELDVTPWFHLWRDLRHEKAKEETGEHEETDQVERLWRREVEGESEKGRA